MMYRNLSFIYLLADSGWQINESKSAHPQIKLNHFLHSEVESCAVSMATHLVARSTAELAGHESPAACLEHRLNTNQTSFTAGFSWGSWETVPSRFFAMVTRDSFQRCHAALSSQQLIHSPPPSGSLRFCPFPVQTLQSPSRPASCKENISYLSSALIMRRRCGFSDTRARP